MAQTILITGCSSGIGLDAAQTMKARGWRVIATARKPEDLARLKQEVGVEALHLELADPQSIATCAVAALELSGGAVDALFNNAGYGQPAAVEDLTPALLRHQLEVNFIGTHDLTRRIIPAMRRRGAGRIVQCSSLLGLVATQYRAAYCSSKFALEALSIALRQELAGTGIHVSVINPGPIRSRFVENALANLRANIDMESSPHREAYRGRLEMLQAGGQSVFKLGPEAVTRKLIHAVESNRPRRSYFVTTPTYLAEGFRRLLPQAAVDFMAKKF